MAATQATQVELTHHGETDAEDVRIKQLEARIAELEGALVEARGGEPTAVAAPLALSSPAHTNRRQAAQGRKAADGGVPTDELTPRGLKRRKRRKQQIARRARTAEEAEAEVDEQPGGKAAEADEAVPSAATSAEDAQALAELALEVAELEEAVAARDAEIAQLKRADELELPPAWHCAIDEASGRRFFWREAAPARPATRAYWRRPLAYMGKGMRRSQEVRMYGDAALAMQQGMSDDEQYARYGNEPWEDDEPDGKWIISDGGRKMRIVGWTREAGTQWVDDGKYEIVEPAPPSVSPESELGERVHLGCEVLPNEEMDRP